MDAGMIPFQKAYVMICERGYSSERRTLIPYPISLHDFRHPCWQSRIGTFLPLTIPQLELIARLHSAHLVRSFAIRSRI